jgi:hypothetical protein
MQWLSIVTWVVALSLVLPAGGTLLPSLGTLVLIVMAGLGTMIVFGITGEDVWAWLSFGLACLAAVLAVIGARTLIYDEAELLQGVHDLIKGTAALMLGVALPILLAVVPMTLGTAVT